MEWSVTVIDWPSAVLAVGLVASGWVLIGSRADDGWHQLVAAGLMLVGAALMGKQLLDLALRPDLPDMAQCQSLLAAGPGDAPESPVDIAPPGTIGFVSGAAWGVYWRMGEDLAAITRTLGVSVPLVNLRSQGSVDNVRRMQGSSNAGMGIVQGDLRLVMDASVNGADGLKQLSAVAALHSEAVQVLTRADVLQRLGAPGLQALKNQRVVVAADSEGAWLTARHLLKWANKDGVVVAKVPADQALCEVVSGRAAAMVVVAGKPTPLLMRLQRLAPMWRHALGALRFVPITRPADGEPLDAVYEDAELGVRDYPWLPPGTRVPTLSVRAMLVSFDFDSLQPGAAHPKCAQIRQLVCTLRGQRLRLRQPPYDPAWREVGDLGPTGVPAAWPVNRCVPAATPTC